MSDMTAASVGSVNGVAIDDSFAEAFPMVGTRLVITAPTAKWARIAAQTMTGFATSVIACGVEAGIEAEVTPDATPDGRPGVAVLLFSMDMDTLQKQLRDRAGQCVLTCPGTACFAGMAGGKALNLGRLLRYFGDGWQASKLLDGRRFWRVPVMDGEFLVEENTGSTDQAVGGGNMLLLATSFEAALTAAEAAVEAIAGVAGAIAPFPGGIVRSGSKVGSKYQGQIASTNHLYCPTLKGAVNSALGPEIESVLEIVIDAVSYDAVAEAMRTGIAAACATGGGNGLVRIGAGNYGGNLGPHHFHLKDLLP